MGVLFTHHYSSVVYRLAAPVTWREGSLQVTGVLEVTQVSLPNDNFVTMWNKGFLIFFLFFFHRYKKFKNKYKYLASSVQQIEIWHDMWC